MDNQNKKEIPKKIDVVIIGGGYSGLNTARILSQRGLSCQIIAKNSGASKFWNGTIDFLNYPGDNLELELAKFQVTLPDHPYSNLGFSEIQESLDEFGKDFSTFKFFKEGKNIVNRNIITPVGVPKLSIAVWNSIFIDYQKFSDETLAFFIVFEEFKKSSTPLIIKGMREMFPGNFLELKISLKELFLQMNSELIKNIDENNLNSIEVAKFFDSKAIHMSIFALLLKNEIQKQFPEMKSGEINYLLFPPILGLDNTQTILNNLNTFLKIDCFEFLSHSPSILANRFKKIFKRKLDLLSVITLKNKIFNNFSRNDENNHWIVNFSDENNKIQELESEFIVIAVGSLFSEGIFSDKMSLANLFLNLGLEYPNSLNNNFEVLGSGKNSNIFLVGSAIYNFSTNISEDDEIQDGTGIGLGITTGFKVANTIINRKYH